MIFQRGWPLLGAFCLLGCSSKTEPPAGGGSPSATAPAPSATTTAPTVIWTAAPTPPPEPSTVAPAASEGCPADLKIGLVSAEKGGIFLFESKQFEVDKLPAGVLPKGVDPSKEETLGKAEPNPITPEIARSLGASGEDTPVFLYEKPGDTPCAAKLGGYFALVRSQAPLVWVEIARKLEGCKAPAGPKAEAPLMAVRSKSPLKGCKYQKSAPLASATAVWDEKASPAKLVKIEKKGAIPADIEALIPKKECKEPECSRLFALSGVEPEKGPSVYDLRVTWATPGKKEIDMYCGVKNEGLHVMIVRPFKGSPPRSYPVEGDAPEGILADARGTFFALRMDHNHFHAWRQLPSDDPKLITSVQFAHFNEEGAHADPLLPYCGP